MALPAALLWPAAPAGAGHGGNVHCGDTITVSTTLSGNVVEAGTGAPCAGDGVIIGNSSITLDLNGFGIIGNGDSADAADDPDDAGVLLDGMTNVTITDSSASNSASITGFDTGVAVQGGSGNTLENITIAGNVGMSGDYGEGVHVRNSDNNRIQGNTLVGNGPYAGLTLLWDSDGNTVDGNTIAASTATHQDIGIRLEQDVTPLGAQTCTSSPAPPAASTTDNNVVTNNVVEGSVIDGISILGGHCPALGNELAANTVRANGRDGIRLNNLVKSSDVHDNTICANGGAGIRATLNALANTIEDNTVGSPSPCTPNNPAVAAPPVSSPLLPPHGDLNDGNVDCDDSAGLNDNVWSNNSHVSEWAAAGSATTGATPPDYTCLN